MGAECRDGGSVVEITVVRDLGDNCMSSRWEKKCVYFEPYFDRQRHEWEGLLGRKVMIGEAEVR